MNCLFILWGQITIKDNTVNGGYALACMWEAVPTRGNVVANEASLNPNAALFR